MKPTFGVQRQARSLSLSPFSQKIRRQEEMMRKQKELQQELERQRQEAQERRQRERRANAKNASRAANRSRSPSPRPDGYRGEEIRADSPPIPSMRGKQASI